VDAVSAPAVQHRKARLGPSWQRAASVQSTAQQPADDTCVRGIEMKSGAVWPASHQPFLGEFVGWAWGLTGDDGRAADEDAGASLSSGSMEA